MLRDAHLGLYSLRLTRDVHPTASLHTNSALVRGASLHLQSQTSRCPVVKDYGSLTAKPGTRNASTLTPQMREMRLDGLEFPPNKSSARPSVAPKPHRVNPNEPKSKGPIVGSAHESSNRPRKHTNLMWMDPLTHIRYREVRPPKICWDIPIINNGVLNV